MIALKNVDFSYGGKAVLKNFELTVENGEAICLCGPSGCGKSTVLKLIAGLIAPKHGKITADGKVSMVFQEDRLIPRLNIKENIAAVADGENYLEALGLNEAAEKLPKELSGGMARRAAIARALAFGGDILLLDEPFNGIDSENKKKAAELILNRFNGKSILLVSHNDEDIALLKARKIEMPKI